MNSFRICRVACSSGWLAVLTAFTLLVAQAARADGPDEEYLQIFDLIGQADAFSEKGQPDRAKARYLEAQKKLTDFKIANPTWNPNIISHRLKYVSGKLGTEMPKVVAPAETSTASAGPASSASSSPRSDMKLISNGAEPRMALRYHPKVGDKQSVTGSIEETSSVGGPGGMRLPTMRMEFVVEVTDVSADGEISFIGGLGDMSLDDDGKSPEKAAMVAALSAALKEVKTPGKSSSRGVWKSSDAKLPENSPTSMMGGSATGKFLLNVEFPEDSVGVGAKWETERQARWQGAKVTEKTTYEITSIDGDRVVLKTTMAQHAANQKISNPMVPSLKMDLKKLEAKSGGTVTVDLGKLLPVSMDAQMDSEESMSMNRGGQKRDINDKSSAKIKMESR